MILEFGKDYRIRTDERNFILQKRGGKPSKATPDYNIINRNERWIDCLYFGKLKYAIDQISTEILKENTNIKIILNKLDEVKNITCKFIKEMESRGEKVEM
ncbi:hypothetical protein BJV85_002858 [Clostridium acetobutylicum]|uniref:Uncharacterized protein n=1 Tax=Clostridium acetobutylicum (strain ATCC 824 / DSM 792 / JCM 1419 / IAM 19013 / LMG 5710 / NBRC 13948 / NRRL B-527 / VKM B-1787 / 2291 / W) TaxID=272562 RepID=Q97JY1_CLOAB|nr:MULTISPECIES: hypothetical protein [Clostridium]AAK79114.1 Hypothetical protein CA_C1141 [Clostridium acetobutylicum ATCC 824]ADZ20190.1 Conserved hypothetical protein [Clostridium acetobutylicum EA 2018]AEI31650.1 hypothetical protein SMB_G1160 [Clostridium acetobutylicum DSM 1731]AWV81632.1 hypothetical protein DK921_16350 [Clostridium acetobutylicum]MBC2393278.1 hypothetical protein [Clostridium acetobutylicum]